MICALHNVIPTRKCGHNKEGMNSVENIIKVEGKVGPLNVAIVRVAFLFSKRTIIDGQVALLEIFWVSAFTGKELSGEEKYTKNGENEPKHEAKPENGQHSWDRFHQGSHDDFDLLYRNGNTKWTNRTQCPECGKTRPNDANQTSENNECIQTSMYIAKIENSNLKNRAW